MPQIQDILHRRSGYKFFTKLDLSMCYYTYELDAESQDLCTIVTPFRLFKYLRCPMGLSIAPMFAQEVIDDLLRDEGYIDDIGCFDSSWAHHLRTLDESWTACKMPITLPIH